MKYPHMTHLLSTLYLAGCGTAASAIPSAPNPRTRDLAHASARSKEGARQPATNPSTTLAAPPVGAASSPFYVIGQLTPGLSLYPVGDRAFLVSDAGIEFVLNGDDVVQDPRLKRGLPVGVSPWEAVRVAEVEGHWPDSVWLSGYRAQGRGSASTLWRWDGKSWVYKDSTIEMEFIFGMIPWLGGRLLALKLVGPVHLQSFVLLSGARDVPLPEFAKDKPDPEFPGAERHARLTVQAFSALPSGEVFAAGFACEGGTELEGACRPHVERWTPRTKKSHLEPLPSADGPKRDAVIGSIAAFAPNDVYLIGETTLPGPKGEATDAKPYLMHFDGSAWRETLSPVPGGVAAMWAESGGARLIADRKGQLWLGSATGSWQPMPLPTELPNAAVATIDHTDGWTAPLRVLNVWFRSSDDVWAIVNSGVDSYLLHTHPKLRELPTPAAFEAKERELRLPGPPLSSCQTPFVLLYTLGRSAPKNYDYPATRAALQGHGEFSKGVTFIEFTRQGRRYFGAHVPDFELGDQLATLVKAKVPGSTPNLVCHDPIPERILKMDSSPSAAPQ